VRSLPIKRPTLDDPVYEQQNPHQTFLLILSLFSAAPMFVTHSSGSAVLDKELSPDTVLVWGACLMLGSILALAGEFWRGHTWDGLQLERAGLLLVGTGAALYASVILFTVDPNGTRFVVGVTAAYAAACLWRCVQITRRLAWIRKVIDELNAERDASDA
jgi:hypothetical protein